MWFIFGTKAPEGVAVTGSVIRRTITTFTVSWDQNTQVDGYAVILYDVAAFQITRRHILRGNSNTLITLYGLTPGLNYGVYTSAMMVLTGQNSWRGDFTTQHCHNSGTLILKLLINNPDL